MTSPPSQIAMPQTIGNYPVERELGRGGMGVVYLARDPRLDRQVAIKVLPPAFAQDPDRLARFQREARLLAALNHRNVASIYGLEEADGHHLLVLEYVPGQTLTQRLHAGPIPIDEVLKVCVQIAEGLEAAHDRDVVHRDLKPDNIRITPEGVVKILDFGLATSSAPATARPTSEATTAIARLTAITAISHPGMIMGTPGYMSPEQARGLVVDKRTDIWSFACILYECLTGVLLFNGSTVGDFIAAVLEREPDWNSLPPRTPPKIRDLLKRCTAKEPRKRLRDIGDARIELEELLATPMTAWFKPGDPAASGATATGAAVGRSRAVARLAMLLPAELPLSNERRSALAISPDSVSLAFVSTGPGAGQSGAQHPAGSISGGGGGSVAGMPSQTGVASTGSATSLGLAAGGTSLSHGTHATPAQAAAGRPQICLRRMDSLDIRPMAGTVGAESPFFSPDGQYLAFFSGGKLRKAPVGGGSPVSIAEAPNPGGGAWDATSAPGGAGGTIFFIADVRQGLAKVPGTGGPSALVVPVDAINGQRAFLHPAIVPGGRTALVTVIGGSTTDGGTAIGAAGGMDDASIVAIHLQTGKSALLLQGGSCPRYTSSGQLVYASGGALYAAPMDPDKLAITGTPTQVVERVLCNALGGVAHASFSNDGTLVYAAGGVFSPRHALLGVPRGTLTTDPATAASIVPMLAESRPFLAPSISPDGQMLAVQVQGLTDSIWVYDLQRKSGTMLNADGDASSPVWSPDSRRVTFRLSRGGAGRDAIVTMNADGSGAPDVLYESDQSPTPGSWSSDGRTLAFTQHHPHTGLDVWVLRMDRGGEARPLVQSPFNSWGPRFSPDGSLLAYASDHSGRPEVYVQAFPSGSRWQASSEGGHSPIWLPSGGELFFRSLNNAGATAVRIATQPTFMVGRPRVAFEGSFLPGSIATPNYDIHPKTGEFVLVRAEQSSEPTTQLAVVLNWFEEIRRRSSLILGSPQEA